MPTYLCSTCEHDHQGDRLAYICIGCPCPETPGKCILSRCRKPRGTVNGILSPFCRHHQPYPAEAT